MIRRLALAATAVFLVGAGVALAAPARTVTVTADTPATWEGGPGTGVGHGVSAIRCTPIVYECEDTLVDLKAAGDLVAEIKGDDAAPDLDVAIYESDAEGTAPGPGDEDNPIAEDISTNKDAKVTARRLQPGFYVVRVRFFDATLASYSGTARLQAPPPPVAPVAPAPSPPAQPAPTAEDDAKAKRKQAKKKCRKKAKKIKNKKKRKKALKRCKRKG